MTTNGRSWTLRSPTRSRTGKAHRGVRVGHELPDAMAMTGALNVRQNLAEPVGVVGAIVP